jgi:hypothetical protein
MGSTVTGGNLTVEINAKDENNESFTEVVLMKNGAVAETINLNQWANNITIIRTLTGVDKDYIYVKVTQADGDEAISSPVFIEGIGNIAPEVAITYPANNDEFNEGDLVTISATASDADGIAKVEFYQDGINIFTDYISPYEYPWTPDAAGTFKLEAKAFDNFGASNVSTPVVVTVNKVVEPPVTKIAESRISQGTDDAEQYAKGTMVLDHPELNIVYESKTTGNQIIGLRFTGLTIPQGATITSAYIEFMAANGSTTASSLTIKGEAADYAATFSTKSKNISSRAKTVASVAWSPETWTAAKVYQTGELNTIVQEIVNRAGWTSGNSMAFIITGTGTRTAESNEGSSEAAPFLYVEYTTTYSAAIAEKSAVKPVDEMIQNSGLLLYPNPVHDVLTVRFDGKTDVERILVYSITGSLVKEIKVNKVMTEAQVDCSNFVPGTYLLKLSNSKGSYSLQFIKQ